MRKNIHWIVEKILRNVWQHCEECFATFPKLLGDIPENVREYSPERLATIPGIIGDILRNI